MSQSINNIYIVNRFYNLMVNGGDILKATAFLKRKPDEISSIDKNAISDAFIRIKEDMVKLHEEIFDLKQEQKKMLEENITLRNNSDNVNFMPMISDVVKETLKNIKPKNTFDENLIKKFNKKRKSIIISRIKNLAANKNLTIPEIKDTIVDTESLCSKATFYRYLDKLKKRKMVDTIKIDDIDILVSI